MIFKKNADEESIKKILLKKFNASMHFEIEKLEKVSFITTNIVYIYDKKIVLKKIASEVGFNSELAVYQNQNRYDFKIPKLISYYKDEGNNFWIVLEYIQSENASNFLEQNHNQAELIVKEIVYALVDFETKSINQNHLGIRKWSMSESLESLLKKIEIIVPADSIISLRTAIKRADNLIIESQFKPCFDAFLNNVLITKTESGKPLIYFCDFDKAYRAVPSGEQLTHFLFNEILKNYVTDAVDLYSSLIGHNKESIFEILEITAFARALSGLRDNCSLFNTNNKPIGAMIENDFKLSNKFINYSKSFFSKFSDKIKLNKSELRNIDNLFYCLENHLLKKLN
jgi:serine/threonine protein kinase